MDRQSPVLRAAEPVVEEGLVYARYLDELAPGFRYTLGSQAVEIVAAAYVEPGHDLSYEHTTFAELDGTIIGVVSGYTAEQHRGSSGEPIRRAAGGSVRGRVGAMFLGAWLGYFGTRDDGDFYVWLLAVSEGHRGQGIGSTLMDHAEGRARECGSDLLSLDVEAKNEGARRFYERRGMTVVSGWPKVPLVPQQVVRMSKSL